MTTAATLEFPVTASNRVRKDLLIGLYEDGETKIPIIGFMVFWNIRDVDVTREQFAAALRRANLSDKYAREHNARSALIRALATLKEQKIVRMVHEDKSYASFQFTAELKTGTGEASRLSYNPEVIVGIDKERYTMFKDDEPDAFRNSILKVDNPSGGQAADAEAIKDQLALAFNAEMSSYKSSDITRYLQKIFTDLADIVSLREQGSVYFIPAAYRTVVESVRSLVSEIGGTRSRFDSIPMPDLKDTRKTVGDSFAEEVAAVLANLDTEVSEMNSSNKNITEKWVKYRRDVIEQIQKRINMYAEVLGERAGILAGSFDRIGATLKPRVLDL